MFIRLLAMMALFTLSASTGASLINTYTFNAPVYPVGGSSCISEIQANCDTISAQGLSGVIRVDQSALDASGSGFVEFDGLLDFSATNGWSSWSLGNVSEARMYFEQSNLVGFTFTAAQDYRQGWDERVDGGGENLFIGHIEIDGQEVWAGRTVSASRPGMFCPDSDYFLSPLRTGCATDEVAVNVFTLGVQAYYKPFSIAQSQVPVPAAAWLFASALLGLGGARRHFSG